MVKSQHPVIRTLSASLEVAVGVSLDDALSAAAADSDGGAWLEHLAVRLRASSAFTKLSMDLCREARAAAHAASGLHEWAAAAEASSALSEELVRQRVLRAAPPRGLITCSLQQLPTGQHCAGSRGSARGQLAAWWDGGGDGVLDLNAFDSGSSQGSSPPAYEQLGRAALMLDPGDGDNGASATLSRDCQRLCTRLSPA
jgi:hypothetical protein